MTKKRDQNNLANKKTVVEPNTFAKFVNSPSDRSQFFMFKGKITQSVGGSRLSFPYYYYDEILQICVGALRYHRFF